MFGKCISACKYSGFRSRADSSMELPAVEQSCVTCAEHAFCVFQPPQTGVLGFPVLPDFTSYQYKMLKALG